MSRPARFLALVAATLAIVAPAPSRACATCGCGDATLTSMGSEVPYRGRLRASLEVRGREDATGTPGENRIKIVEGRLEAGLSWAPDERVIGLVTLPLLLREVTYVNLAKRTSAGAGDAELRAKLVVFRDRPFGPHHIFATTIGLKVPTAPEAEDDGAPLPLELQPGSGSFDPILGLSYATFQGDTSVYASVHGYFPLSIRAGDRPGSSLRTSASVQRQLVDWLAVRVGVDARLDARTLEDGHAEKDSGGFIGFLSSEVLVEPTEDLELIASVRIPTVNALAGDHDEGPITSLVAAFDF